MVVRPEPVVQRAVRGAERIAGDRIERAERLVHQHHVGSRRQRARDADPLALAAGQRSGKARRKVVRQRDQIEQLRDAGRDSPRDQPRSCGVMPMFSPTVMCGNRPTSWNT